MIDLRGLGRRSIDRALDDHAPGPRGKRRRSGRRRDDDRRRPELISGRPRRRVRPWQRTDVPALRVGIASLVIGAVVFALYLMRLF